MFDRPPNRLLVIKPSAFGDVVQHIVVVRALALAWPEAKVDWLVNSEFVEMVSRVEEVHQVIAFERSAMRGLRKVPASLDRLNRLVRTLRRNTYDVVLDMQGLLRSGLLSLTSGAPYRLGFAGAREMAWLGYNRRVDVSAFQHSADRSFALGDALGRPLNRKISGHVPTGEAEQRILRGIISAKPESGRIRDVVLVPGAQWKSKQWPAEFWRGLIENLLKRGDVRILLTGTKAERELVAGIASGFGESVVNVAGRTSLLELAALLRKVDLVVANDTGTMHLAVAQGTEVLALFGPSDPSLSGPWGRPDAVLRATNEVQHRMYRIVPDDRMMRMISVEAVAARCRQVLDSAKDKHG